MKGEHFLSSLIRQTSMPYPSLSLGLRIMRSFRLFFYERERRKRERGKKRLHVSRGASHTQNPPVHEWGQPIPQVLPRLALHLPRRFAHLYGGPFPHSHPSHAGKKKTGGDEAVRPPPHTRDFPISHPSFLRGRDPSALPEPSCHPLRVILKRYTRETDRNRGIGRLTER